MFTGIVEAVGEVREVQPRGPDAGVIIGAGELDLRDVKVGDSIAVNGCCLTVVELPPGAFRVDVSRETLERTIGFEAGSRVNLANALRASDRLGGHLVTGHIDDLGESRAGSRSARAGGWRCACRPSLPATSLAKDRSRLTA